MEHLIIAPTGNIYFVCDTSNDGHILQSLTASGAWVNDTNFAAVINDDGNVQLHQPYPNPAVNTITLEYQLPAGTTSATISIYDLAGRGITTLDLDPTPGRHSLTLTTDSYPPGVYLAHLATNTASETRRFVISR